MKIPIFWLEDYIKVPNDLKLLTDKLTAAGHLLDKVEKRGGEIVIDLELRGNRADCYSIIGIAREVSALFGFEVNYPKIYNKLKKIPQLKECKNDIKTPLVKRVTMTVVNDVKIGPSPKWMKDRLEACGVASINNIVDLTNYVMLETGEPMHAFDLNQIGPRLEIRLAKKNEKMVTFLGETLTLTDDDLVWANDKHVLSVAGAIGEKNHSISDKTKTVLFEAANYDRSNIRRTIYRHHLLTEAGIRHEKDLDPSGVKRAINRTLYLIEENHWGKIQPYVFDYYPVPAKPQTVKLDLDYLESLGGVKFSAKQIKNILTRLNFQITAGAKKTLTVLCPTYRTDVTLEEDLIEEILRIHGYENIPTRTLSLEIPPVVTPGSINQELDIKNLLVELGFNEVISSAFVGENNLQFNQAVDYNTSQKTIKIKNKPSPDIEVLRSTLFPNLLNMTQKVINNLGNEARFFEVGKIYYQEKRKYYEKRKLGIICWGKENNGYRNFKGRLEAFFEKSCLKDVSFKETSNLNQALAYTYDIYRKNEIIGGGFQYGDIYYAEVDLDSILDKTQKPAVSLWLKFPPQIEDLSLTFPEKTHVGDVLNFIKSQNYIKNANLSDSYKGSFTYRIWYQNPKKTMTNEEVEKIRNEILSDIKSKFGGVLKL